ncbi:MAG: hypothetical protein P1U56_19045 [Saprospiraceae bacterium]|nr:hypothetical protein [Saprospiraceae bacterium]
MSWHSKIQSKIEVHDDSPELKRGQVKQILMAEMHKILPEFEFLEYDKGCYTFEKKRSIHQLQAVEHLHILFSLKERNFSCSVASRVNMAYRRVKSYNAGLLNPHADLLVLKEGNRVLPVEEAYYFHNGKVKTTTKTIQRICQDFKEYGLPFLNNQATQLLKSPLLMVGLEFISKLNISKAELKLELEKNLSNGHSISNIKSEDYMKLKTELQDITGIDRERRKKIPKLAYELLEYYCSIE